jgi:hypothetical protein
VNTDSPVITILILLLTMVISVVVTQFVRRRKDLFTLREIPAYSTLPLVVGESIEANRPMHVSLGSAGIGGANTLLALASAELAYQVVQRAAIGAVAPILTVSDASALSLAQDTLRRAYRSRDLLDRYRIGSAQWYPAGGRSLAFAAALTAVVGNDRVAGNVLAGSYGPELALISEAAIRRDQHLVATSDQLEGQAVALVMAEHPLLGEDVFAAGAYLGQGASQIAGVVTQDVLRWLLILFIFIPTELAVIGQFREQFLRGEGGVLISQETANQLIIVEIVLLALFLLIRSVLGLRRRAA